MDSDASTFYVFEKLVLIIDVVGISEDQCLIHLWESGNSRKVALNIHASAKCPCLSLSLKIQLLYVHLKGYFLVADN